MHILLTGGAGYIGSHIAKLLSTDENTKVTIVDNLTGGSFDSISVLKRMFKPQNFNFIQLNLNNQVELIKVFESTHFDAVIHLAANLQVSESVSNPLKYYLNNTVNSTNLINICLKHKIKNFVFSSTAAVYGHPTTFPVTENTTKNPINPYGMSKLMTENILKDVSSAHSDFNYVALRYFNVAGADFDGLLGECHIPETHLIPLAIRAALGEKKQLSLYGDNYETPDGTCIRDYIHVNDLARAHIKAIDYLMENNMSNTFNCGYNAGFSVKQVIDVIKNISNSNFKVIIKEKRAGDPAILIADNNKIKTILDWCPQHNNLEQICKTAYMWEKTMLNK